MLVVFFCIHGVVHQKIVLKAQTKEEDIFIVTYNNTEEHWAATVRQQQI